MNEKSKLSVPMHSALPWKAKPSAHNENGISLGNDNENAAFVPGFADHPHNMANADLIVRAVNAHDALVRALEDAWLLLDGPSSGDSEFLSARKARIDAIDAVLWEHSVR